MNARLALLIIAIVSSGLVAGLLYGWMVSVIPGTRRVADRNYVETMQEINLAIINPGFAIAFMITPVLLAGAAFAEQRAGNTRRAITLVAAAATYLTGVLAVTIGGNVPLNNNLASFDLATASDASTAEQRHAYERPWNRWHNVRTAASVTAFALAAVTLAISEEG